MDRGTLENMTGNRSNNEDMADIGSWDSRKYSNGSWASRKYCSGSWDSRKKNMTENRSINYSKYGRHWVVGLYKIWKVIGSCDSRKYGRH